MSGIEVFGLVLGILPLLISAAEYYEVVARPFKRYRKFVPELELFQQQLGAQKTIFRNECRLLLTSLTGNQLAREMLRETKHASWSDIKLDEDLAHQLGDSGQACYNIVKAIKMKLNAIEEEADNFGHTIQQSIPERSIGDKAWRSRIAKKCKFSVAEPRLEKNIQALRKLNQDFLNLASQTTRLESCSSHIAVDCYDNAIRSDRMIKECRAIQSVSERLYSALQKACQVHDNHSVQFRLDSYHVDTSDEERLLVRFNMGYAHLQESSVVAEPVWITIDSIFEEATSRAAKLNTLSPAEACETLKVLSNLKRGLVEPPVNNKKLKTTLVEHAIPPYSNKSAAATLSKTIEISLPDFCVKHDLCDRLQKRGNCTPDNKYVGYLETSEHLVYFAPPISTCNTMVSLAHLISSTPKTNTAGKFLQYERLRLARKLASAVIQFHATPILNDSLRGDNIMFFSNTESIEIPHIAVHVGERVGQLQKANQTKIIQNIVRNPYIFNLGIVLLELAYQAPIKFLREAEDLEDGQETKLTDFFAAKRLEKTIDASMGVTYANIVRKCLDCDFGEGKDLKSPALQAVFYKDVVCELERLERAFAKLQLT